MANISTFCSEKVRYQYNAPGRYYHNWDHIIDGLTVVTEPLSVYQLIAWIFHDVVYEPMFHGNEQASVDYCFNLIKSCSTYNVPFILSNGTPTHIENVDSWFKASQIEEIIMSTVNHIPIVESAKIVLDMDLSTFARNDFRVQCENIRSEYVHVPDGIFYPKRIEILEGFLARDTLFYTDSMKFLEENARQNLQSEIVFLRNMYES